MRFSTDNEFDLLSKNEENMTNGMLIQLAANAIGISNRVFSSPIFIKESVLKNERGEFEFTFPNCYDFIKNVYVKVDNTLNLNYKWLIEKETKESFELYNSNRDFGQWTTTYMCDDFLNVFPFLYPFPLKWKNEVNINLKLVITGIPENEIDLYYSPLVAHSNTLKYCDFDQIRLYATCSGTSEETLLSFDYQEGGAEYITEEINIKDLTTCDFIRDILFIVKRISKNLW